MSYTVKSALGSGKVVTAAECSDVATGMLGAHGRSELFYYRPVNYERYLRVHAQDFEPLMTPRNCLTPGRVCLHAV